MGLLHPPDHNSAIMAIHWMRMDVKKDHNTKIIVEFTYKENSTSTKHANMHIILPILPNTIQYNSTLEWPKYLHKMKTVHFVHASTTKDYPQKTNT
jgi:hypothetical protein